MDLASRLCVEEIANRFHKNTWLRRLHGHSRESAQRVTGLLLEPVRLGPIESRHGARTPNPPVGSSVTHRVGLFEKDFPVNVGS